MTLFICASFHLLSQNYPYADMDLGSTIYIGSKCLQWRFKFHSHCWLCLCPQIFELEFWHQKFPKFCVQELVLFLPSFIEINWHIILCKFTMYNMMIWNMYIFWNDCHNKVSWHYSSPHRITILCVWWEYLRWVSTGELTYSMLRGLLWWIFKQTFWSLLMTRCKA